MVDLLQRLLLKIKVTKQPVYQLHPDEVEFLASQLLTIKTNCIHTRAFEPQESQDPFSFGDIPSLIKDDMRNVPLDGHFQMWQLQKSAFSYCSTSRLALGSPGWSFGCLSPCQKYLKNPYNAIFLKSQGSKDIKNDILDCQIHKYTNTNSQIHKYSL